MPSARRRLSSESAQKLIEDAKIMVDAGAVALLLEAVPMQVARIITEMCEVPVIGCVGGPSCDGTVVVMHDMLGLTDSPPSFVKQYGNLGFNAAQAARAFADEVVHEKFPGKEHSYQ